LVITLSPTHCGQLLQQLLPVVNDSVPQLYHAEAGRVPLLLDGGDTPPEPFTNILQQLREETRLRNSIYNLQVLED
jgi:hypothetical protein